MKRNTIFVLALLATIIATAFSSCKKDSIETIPLESVNGEIIESVYYGSKIFFFNFYSDIETYPVTYEIRNSSNIEGNQVDIELIDIQKDRNDNLDIQKGPASCSIELGNLDEGQYNLNIKSGNYSTTGTFTISGSLITCQLNQNEGISLRHDTVHRIPFGTVWGYLGYQNSSYSSIANAFLSNLNSIGAEQANLPEGYYGYFSVSDSGTIIQPINENISYYKEFFKSYSGDPNSLDNLVSHYKTEYYNKVDLYFYWFWDGEYKSARLPKSSESF